MWNTFPSQPIHIILLRKVPANPNILFYCENNVKILFRRILKRVVQRRLFTQLVDILHRFVIDQMRWLWSWIFKPRSIACEGIACSSRLLGWSQKFTISVSTHIQASHSFCSTIFTLSRQQVCSEETLWDFHFSALPCTQSFWELSVSSRLDIWMALLLTVRSRMWKLMLSYSWACSEDKAGFEP